jgi:cobyric acid synthase
LSNNLSDNWGTVFLLGQNSLPVEHLLMLNKFIEDKLDQIPTPEQLLNSQPEDAIKALKSVIGSGSKKRIDISSILSRRIMNYTLVNHKKFSKDMVNTYAEIMESEYMSPDLVLLSVKKTTKLFPQLISRPKLISILTT